MFDRKLVPTSASSVRGFTLIELLVTCGIMAALAVTIWGAYTGVQASAENDIANADLRRVAEALRRFKADTGYYPGQGPFFLSSSAIGESDCTASDGILRLWAAPNLDVERGFWFTSPANLALLFDAPLLCSKHPLAYLKAWNPETGRGWHGPYLDKTLRLWVDHGTDLNGNVVVTGGPDGTGSPLAGTKILDIPAYGSGPRFRAAGPTGSPCANQATTSGTCMLGWRSAPRQETGYDADRHELTAHARPFLLFGFANGDYPRVVYVGKDGIYGGRNLTDPCRPNLAASSGSDDRVLCLIATN